MTDKRELVNNGYIPTRDGYQPSQPREIPTGDPAPQGGYIPTSEGGNPTNVPTPPGDE